VIIKNIFEAHLKYIQDKKLLGACHLISASIYMLLKESNINSTLCIGAVRSQDNRFFDHSWIEIDGDIYDATLDMPLKNGSLFPLVFASINLYTKLKTDLEYGFECKEGFEKDTERVLNCNLAEYSELSYINLWNLIKDVGKIIDLEINPNRFKERYGNIKRTLIIR